LFFSICPQRFVFVFPDFIVSRRVLITFKAFRSIKLQKESRSIPSRLPGLDYLTGLIATEK
jgi:hypothetical protein